MTAPAHLLAYHFGADAGFEGQLVGALERIEAGASLRVLDVLFVARDPDSGELFAVDQRPGRASGMVASLVGFRLDVAERRKLTRRAVAGPQAELIASLGETLAPGEALAAVLVSHEWAVALDDAVERIGGATISAGFVAHSSLAELGPELIASARAR